MNFFDISRVTETLLNVIEQYMNLHNVVGGAVTTSPEPADQSVSGSNIVRLFLYHVTKDPNYSNHFPVPHAEPPIRAQPLPLILHYQLSATSDAAGENRVYREQLLHGGAMMALHEYPVVTEKTKIDGTTVMVPALSGQEHRFQISMKPVKAQDAVSFWTAGSSAVRLAQYYEVCVVMLKREELIAPAPRVLKPQLSALPTQTMRRLHIQSVYNQLSTILPGESLAHDMEFRPAQISKGQVLSIDAEGLDDNTILQLQPAGDAPVTLDPVAWKAQRIGQQLTVEVQETLGGQPVAPGVYIARLQKPDPQAPSGSTLAMLTSNLCPFSVVPNVTQIGAPDPNQEILIEGWGFPNATDAIEVFLGDERLTAGNAGSLGFGEFDLLSPTQLMLKFPSGGTPGTSVPLRILVQGMESQPAWVVRP